MNSYIIELKLMMNSNITDFTEGAQELKAFRKYVLALILKFAIIYQFESVQTL